MLYRVQQHINTLVGLFSISGHNVSVKTTQIHTQASHWIPHVIRKHRGRVRHRYSPLCIAVAATWADTRSKLKVVQNMLADFKVRKTKMCFVRPLNSPFLLSMLPRTLGQLFLLGDQCARSLLQRPVSSVTQSAQGTRIPLLWCHVSSRWLTHCCGCVVNSFYNLRPGSASYEIDNKVNLNS